MKKRFFSMITLIAVMVLVCLVLVDKGQATADAVPVLQDDITSVTNVTVDKFSYIKDSVEIIVIEDDKVIKDTIDVSDNLGVTLQYSWNIDDTILVKGGDYFTIPMPKNTEFSVVGLDITKEYAPVYDLNNPTKQLGYWMLVDNDKTTTVGDYYIQFVAHTDFEINNTGKTGFFELVGSFSHDGQNAETIPMTVGKHDIDATFPKTDTSGSTEGAEFPAERYINGEMPNIKKFANGRVNTSGDIPTGEWIVTFGYDDYKELVSYKSTDTYDFHQNVIIRDELFDDGQTFRGLSLRTPVFRPANAEGASTNQFELLTVINNKMLIMDEEDGDYADTAAWEQAVADSTVPTWGLSADRKIAIVNLGTIGSNGMVYTENNVEFEAYLRAVNEYTDAEVEALMKTLGYNGSHTLTLYDGTTKDIVIDNLIQNRIIPYFIGFNVNLENKPGREYTNQVTASYDSGVIDNVLSVNRMYINGSSAGAGGTNSTGNIYLNKYDEGTYTTSKTPIAKVEFALYRMVAGTIPMLVETKETTETGVVNFEDLPQGTYRLYEINAPEHDTNSLSIYKRDSDGKYTAFTDEKGDNYFEFELTIDELYLYFEATNLKLPTPSIEMGNVLLSKVDQDNTDIPLLGASFSLTAQDGTVYMSVPTAGDLYSFSNIPVGIYTIAEVIAPTDYDISSFAGIADVDNVLQGIQIEVTSGELILLIATNEKIIPPVSNVSSSSSSVTTTAAVTIPSTSTPSTPTVETTPVTKPLIGAPPVNPEPILPPTPQTTTANNHEVGKQNEIATSAVPDTSDNNDQLVLLICGAVTFLLGITVTLLGGKTKNKRKRIS